MKLSCQEAFESAVFTDGMYSTKHLMLKKDTEGKYINLYTIYAYLAWQACWEQKRVNES